uniref:LITAF domain-containing protein n=1 Tax=Cyprinus carpio carpio TaxID=630221 RepID=A0A8C1C9V8_CYPCA
MLMALPIDSTRGGSSMQPVAPQVVVVQPQQVLVFLDDTPTETVCKYCHRSIITNVKYKSGSAAWVLLAKLLICGFCLIPFFVRGFKDAHHSCPNFNNIFQCTQNHNICCCVSEHLSC